MQVLKFGLPIAFLKKTLQKIMFILIVGAARMVPVAKSYSLCVNMSS